jgi:hypothetical protein
MSVAEQPTSPPRPAPPSAKNTFAIKFSEAKKCWIFPHVPPGAVERLRMGEWITVTDNELARELIEIARCLGVKAKIEFHEPQ